MTLWLELLQFSTLCCCCVLLLSVMICCCNVEQTCPTLHMSVVHHLVGSMLLLMLPLQVERIWDLLNTTSKEVEAAMMAKVKSLYQKGRPHFRKQDIKLAFILQFIARGRELKRLQRIGKEFEDFVVHSHRKRCVQFIRLFPRRLRTSRPYAGNLCFVHFLCFNALLVNRTKHKFPAYGPKSPDNGLPQNRCCLIMHTVCMWSTHAKCAQ